jgi:hypothetical protein
MPLDLSGFRSEPNQWAGLYHAADQLEKRKLRQDQLAQQRESKRAAAGTFLQNYLDPKDRLTGTAYDPMLVQGLQDAMQQGAQLAMAGADAPALMMALGPMVNKINQYSTNAKTINKQVDDQIKLMRESGLTGYDYGALKEQALRNAFYKTDDKGQASLVDPSDIDPSANYIQKAIESAPDKVTTAAGLDLFAKNSPMNKTLEDRQHYTGTGELDRSKVHLIGQNWLVPQRDKSGKVVDMVPDYDMAMDNDQPIMHDFVDDQGKTIRKPVKILSESVFDDMMQRRPDIADYLKGVTSQHLKEYKDKSGKEISLADPKAKLVARAIAWDELNRRKSRTIERADIIDKPSQAQINLRINQSPEALQNVEDRAAAAKQGRVSVEDPNDPDRYKSNAAEMIGDIFTGKDDVSANPKIKLNGDLYSLGGKARGVKDYEVVDVTSSMKDGGLKAGRGQNFEYKKVYYNPKERALIVDQEETLSSGKKRTKSLEIPEAQVGQFINQIAEANGIDKRGVRALLDKMSYKGGKFGGAAQPAAAPAQAPNDAQSDYQNRKTKRPWKQSMTVDTKKPFQTK